MNFFLQSILKACWFSKPNTVLKSENSIKINIFTSDASGNPVTATVPTTVETVVVTDASGSTVTGNF